MSTKQGEASSEGRDDQEPDSVYDFLYHDAQRIGSFLAQFDPSGHLQQVRQIEGTQEQSNADTRTSVGVDIKVFKADMGAGRGTVEQATASAERVYDPLWSNALEFLGILQSRGLLKEDLGSSSLGQFVICRGELTVVDTDFHFQLYTIDAWRDRSVANTLARVNPATGNNFTEDEIALELGLLTRLRPQLQAYLADADGSIVFSNMKAEGLVTSAHDLMMKYGTVISGQWTIVGIKDADPEGDVEALGQGLNRAMSQHAASNTLTEYFQLATRFRAWVGRPVYCYGVTPLAVFRNIGG